MSFGERIKFRRGELKLSRGELAGRLGVSPSAVSNYENGLSFPKEDVMLRLFDSLETDPNQLFRDSFRGGGQALPTGDVPAPGGAARGQDHPPVPHAGGGWLCFRSAGRGF